MARFIKSGSREVGVYFDAYKGKNYVHIRNVYETDDGARARTSKGVMLTPDAAKEVFAALGAVIAIGPTGVDPFAVQPEVEPEPEPKAKPKRKSRAKASAASSSTGTV